mmetsp:Transcript_21563/g.47319  ORF Transcript_21563/g.47319 Transcript_21563/m.47319 type:complete len:226 (+) Transcript_21563:629-1306(+)
MVVDVGVTDGVHGEADPAGGGDPRQLAIQQGDAGAHAGVPEPVQRHLHTNGCLASLSVGGGRARFSTFHCIHLRSAGIDFVDSLPHGSRKGFEGGLDDVVGVAVLGRGEPLNVDANGRLLHEGGVKRLHQARLVASNQLRWNRDVVLQRGVAREVDGHTLQALVQGGVELSLHLCLVKTQPSNGRANSCSHSVVHLLVACALLAFLDENRKVKHSMGAQLIDHVI